MAIAISATSFRAFAKLDSDWPSDDVLGEYISSGMDLIERVAGIDLDSADVDGRTRAASSVRLACLTAALALYNGRDYQTNMEIEKALERRIKTLLGGVMDVDNTIVLSEAVDNGV